jgi:hypothetical protein
VLFPALHTFGSAIFPLATVEITTGELNVPTVELVTVADMISGLLVDPTKTTSSVEPIKIADGLLLFPPDSIVVADDHVTPLSVDVLYWMLAESS